MADDDEVAPQEIDRARLEGTEAPGRYRATSGPARTTFAIVDVIGDHALVARFDGEYRLIANGGAVERMSGATERVEDRPVGGGWCQEHALVTISRSNHPQMTVERKYVVLLTDRFTASELIGQRGDTIVVTSRDPLIDRNIDAEFLGTGREGIVGSVGAIVEMIEHGGAGELLGPATQKEVGEGWFPIGWTLGAGTPIDDDPQQRWAPVGPLHRCTGERELVGAATAEPPSAVADGSLCHEIEALLDLAQLEYDHFFEVDPSDAEIVEFVSAMQEVKERIDRLEWRLATCRAIGAAPTVGAAASVIEGLDVFGVDGIDAPPGWADIVRAIPDADSTEPCARFGLLVARLRAIRDAVVAQREQVDQQIDTIAPEAPGGRDALWERYAHLQRQINELDMQIAWADHLLERCRDQQLGVLPIDFPDALVLPTPEQVRALLYPRNDVPDVPGPKSPMQFEPVPGGLGCLTSWRFVAPAIVLLITLTIIGAWLAGTRSSDDDTADVLPDDSSPTQTDGERTPEPPADSEPPEVGAPDPSTEPEVSTTTALPALSAIEQEILDATTSVLFLLGLSDVTDAVDVVADPTGGASFESSTDEGLVRLDTSIKGSWSTFGIATFEWLEDFGNQSSHPCGAVTEVYRVTCPRGAGRLAPGEYVMVGVELEGPIDSAGVTHVYGLYFDDDGDESDNFEFVEPFDESFIRNTEHWYQVQVDPDGTRTMWADGMRDGTPGVPRFSSAMFIEYGSTLVWFVPRSEVPGEPLEARASAFATSGDPEQTPLPAEAGGDATGASATDPLNPIDTSGDTGSVIDLDDPSGLPPDVEGTTQRDDVQADPDAQIAARLLDDVERRINAALASGDAENVVRLLHPQFRTGPSADACRAELEASVALADSVTITSIPDAADVTSGFPLYVAGATINYPTGAVEWTPLFLPGPRGALHLVLPSCA